MEKMTVEEMGYVDAMRQRLRLEKDDASKDKVIESMEPMERVRLISGWYHGSGIWADTYKKYFESQGIYLTTNPGADGII